MSDSCIKCDGRGTWELTKKDEWDEILLGALKKWSESKLFKSCSYCNSTGLESVRQTWETDRLDPKKHEFTIWCSENTPCWHCDKMKEEHIN